MAVNQKHHQWDGHLNYILKYISLYYEVRFKILYTEEICEKKIELTSNEIKACFKFDSENFLEKILQIKLKNLWHDNIQALQGGWNDNCELDVFGFIFTYMNIRDEVFVPNEDRTKYGNIKSHNSMILKKDFCHLPVVDLAIDKYFVKKFNLIPRYKNPTYIRTSDCDSVNWRNWFQQSVNFMKALIRLDPIYLELTSLNRVYSSKSCHIELLNDYCSGEATVFLPYVTRPFAINDVKSHVLNNQIDWNVIKRFYENGVEIGLHASIRSNASTKSLSEGKKYVEEMLDAPLFGCRHHYWNVDWMAPWLTYRKHINAGFKYDSGMALRDTFGFRSGVSRPYRPFDYGRKRALDFYLFPTFLMDSHIYRMPAAISDIDQHLKKLNEAISAIKSINGFLIVDWHTETFVDTGPYSGFPSALSAFEDIFVDPEIFKISNLWNSLHQVHRSFNP